MRKKVLIGCTSAIAIIAIVAAGLMFGKHNEVDAGIKVVTPTAGAITETVAEISPTTTPTPEPTLNPFDSEDIPVIPSEFPEATPTETAQVTTVPTPKPSETVSEDTVTPEVTNTSVKVTQAPKVTAVPKATAVPTKAPTVAPTKTPTPTVVPVSTELTAGKFAQIIFNIMEIPLANDNESNAYDTAVTYGFFGTSLFENHNEEVVRKKAYIALHNVASYLGVTADENILTKIDEYNRISDLSGTNEEKTAMKFLLATGIVEGKSNGSYSHDRAFQPKKKISSEDAVTYATRVVNAKERVKISPDGQVCRTTNMPEFTKFYPYILESFPNEYYDWEFQFMKAKSSYAVIKNGKKVYTDDYIYYHETDGDYYSSPVVNTKSKKQYIDDYGKQWQSMIEDYLKLIFNVNYKTTPKDKDWYNSVLKLMSYYGTGNESEVKENLDAYLASMKELKIAVECDKVAVDLSTYYNTKKGECIRVYVHYKIVSLPSNYGASKYFPELVFSNDYWTQDFLNVTKGKWRNGYFDIIIDSSSFLDNGGLISGAALSDTFHSERKVTVK